MCAVHLSADMKVFFLHSYYKLVSLMIYKETVEIGSIFLIR